MCALLIVFHGILASVPRCVDDNESGGRLSKDLKPLLSPFFRVELEGRKSLSRKKIKDRLQDSVHSNLSVDPIFYWLKAAAQNNKKADKA